MANIVAVNPIRLASPSSVYMSRVCVLSYNNSDYGEEEGRHDTVAEHLQHGSAESQRVQRGDSHEYVSMWLTLEYPMTYLRSFWPMADHAPYRDVHRSQPDEHGHPCLRPRRA